MLTNDLYCHCEGSVGGGGQQRADWQDIVVKRNGDLNLRGRQQHPASRSILRILCDIVLVGQMMMSRFNDLHMDIFRDCLTGLYCSWLFLEAPAFFCLCFTVVTEKIMSLFWTHCSISSPFFGQLKIKQSLSRTRSRRRLPHFIRQKVISHFYPIYRHINIFSEQTFQCLGDKTLKIFSSKYFCSVRV